MPVMAIPIAKRTRKFHPSRCKGLLTHTMMLHYSRHLLRHWLHPENAWKLPPQLESTWNHIYHNKREEIFPLEATFRLI